jgi:hypothetical protein
MSHALTEFLVIEKEVFDESVRRFMRRFPLMTLPEAEQHALKYIGESDGSESRFCPQHKRIYKFPTGEVRDSLPTDRVLKGLVMTRKE